MDENQDTLLLKSGDIGVLKKLFDRYSREMYFFAMGLVNDHAVAEDAIQESFVYIWNHRDRLDTAYSIAGYLRKSIRNYVLNYLRHQRTRLSHEENIIREQNFQYQEDTDLSDMIVRMRVVMNTLPEQCRRIFIMAVIEGKTYTDIAGDLGVSVNTVKTQVRIAYKKIRTSVRNLPAGTFTALLMLGIR